MIEVIKMMIEMIERRPCPLPDVVERLGEALDADQVRAEELEAPDHRHKEQEGDQTDEVAVGEHARQKIGLARAAPV